MINLITLDLHEMKSTELKNLGKEFKIKNYWNLKKEDLIKELNLIKGEQLEKSKEENPIVNLITLKEIAADLKINESKARRILRNSNIERPYKRWEWDKDLHSNIIEKVKSLLTFNKEDKA